MVRRMGFSLVLAAVFAAGAVTVTSAQKGKPKPPPVTGVLTFDSGGAIRTRDSITSLPAQLNVNNELSISGLQNAMVLDFAGQLPSGSVNLADCDWSSAPGGCFWDWSSYPTTRDAFSTFALQTNTLTQDGSAELEGGLLGIANGATHEVRFNMTITVPETATVSHWRFDFNPGIPGNGGADTALVTRLDACTFVFSATSEYAALSILVKPQRGKQYVHREGRYTMPFTATFVLDSCTP